jgi:hypothetical protein
MPLTIRRLPAHRGLPWLLALALLTALFGTGARPAVAAGLTVSVTQYGAVGDGTTDNTTAFRNALRQFTSAGGTLTIPAGTYMLQPSQITIHDNITVAGSQAIIKANVVGYSLFDVSGANITLTGLTIDGNNQAVQGTEVASGSSNILLSQDTYQNFTQTAGTGSQFYSSLPVGVHIDNKSTGITIDSTTVQNVVALHPDGWPDPVARGVWIEGDTVTSSKNITIENSTFGNVAPKDDGDCIVIQDATEYANLQVLHNTFDGCAKRAIKIQVPGAVIANNTIINPFLGNNSYVTVTPPTVFDMYSAISVYASNVAVFGNTITGVGSYYNAIELGLGVPLSNVSVQGNSVQMGSGSGANLGAPSSFLRAFSAIDELTVTNNTFSTGNAANTVPNGIRLDVTVTRPTIKNNTMSNVTTPIQCVSACQASYPPSLAVPAYFPPGAPWTQLDQAAPTAGLAVINPNNGPGAASDAAYASQVAASQSAGIAVLGYVYTRYANSQTDTITNGGYDRTIANVEADIDNYLAWYHVDGIFLDEATNTCDAPPLNYYTTLVTYIKEKGGKGLVALNPGTATGECYMTAAPAADFFVTFEGHYSDYISGAYSQPAWVSNYSPSRFWHLIYDAPDVASMQNAVNLGKQRGAGWLYVTPDGASGSNPWSALPSDPYWTDELDALQGIQPPTRQLQTIRFTAPTPSYVYAPTLTFPVTATASSGLPVAFSVAAGNPCTVATTPNGDGSHTATVSHAGTCVITAGQPGNGDYAAAANVAQTFTIAKATPVLTWATPTDIIVGAALSSTQLNATAAAPGTFVYTPPVGAVLEPGSGQTLSASLTPTDSADYNSGTAKVTISVQYRFAFLPPLGSVRHGGGGGEGTDQSTTRTVSTFEVGQVIPVKLSLTNAQGDTVKTATATLTANGQPAVATTGQEGDNGRSVSGNHFRFQGGHYQFNLKTTGLVAGPLALVVTLDDGATHSITITLVAPNSGDGKGNNQSNSQSGQGTGRSSG